MSVKLSLARTVEYAQTLLLITPVSALENLWGEIVNIVSNYIYIILFIWPSFIMESGPKSLLFFIQSAQFIEMGPLVFAVLNFARGHVLSGTCLSTQYMTGSYLGPEKNVSRSSGIRPHLLHKFHFSF